MGTVKFIHCADLHLDTPFQGLSEVDEERGRILNGATFQSFQNIVNAAIQNEVDFVVIAGDVYNSADRSLSAQFKFQKGLQRLAEHGIEAFIACGNHDPLSGWSATIEWPQTAHTFAGDHVDIRQVARDGHDIATLCGMSYEKEAVRENLASLFPRPDGGLPSIAVLHSNVGGDTLHLPYAPTTVDELCSKGFDYWALGHVHAHRVLRADGPAIVYPGCAQSRQPNETGPKGCCVVTLSDAAPPDIRFAPTDVVRYHGGTVDISECASQDEVRRAIVGACRTVSEASQGRHAIVRLSLTGTSAMHRELARAGNMDALLHAVREEVEGWEPWVWPEKFPLETRGTYDIDVQRGREDVVGDLISVYDTLLDPSSGRLEERRQELEDALSSWQGYRFLKDRSEQASVTRDELAVIAEQARRLTLDRVVEES